MTHILKVYGPNLKGPFDSDFETHVLEDVENQLEVHEDGDLTVVLPPTEARTHPSGRRIKARGTTTILYPAGQWSKIVCWERVDEEDTDGSH